MNPIVKFVLVAIVVLGGIGAVLYLKSQSETTAQQQNAPQYYGGQTSPANPPPAPPPGNDPWGNLKIPGQ